MVDELRHSYGLSRELFITPKASGDSVVFGGTAENGTRWTRVLSNRAAQMLWYHLTQLLFPEQTGKAASAIATAPFRAADQPTITTSAMADKLENSHYEITGYAGSQVWQTQIREDEARHFWKNLTNTLHPAGWETIES